METITKNIFTFDELTEEAQDKAIEKLYDLNVDCDWWNYDDIYHEIAKDYGLKLNMKEVCFDLDRGNFVAFETFNHGRKENYIPGILMDDEIKFIKKAGLKLNKRLKECGISVNHKHYGGGDIANYLEFNNEITEEEQESLNDCLNDFLREILKQLRNEYEYLTSKEAIIETIQCNDYYFDEEGNLQ